MKLCERRPSKSFLIHEKLHFSLNTFWHLILPMRGKTFFITYSCNIFQCRAVASTFGYQKMKKLLQIASSQFHFALRLDSILNDSQRYCKKGIKLWYQHTSGPRDSINDNDFFIIFVSDWHNVKTISLQKIIKYAAYKKSLLHRRSWYPS